MAPRIDRLLLVCAGVTLTACGGGGGGSKPGPPPPPPAGPVIGLAGGTFSATQATLVVPLQASGSSALTTTWTFPSGATTAVWYQVTDGAGTTEFRFATNGTWRAVATVTDTRGSSTLPVMIEVSAPLNPPLRGQVLDGASGDAPSAGVPWRLVWSPEPEVQLTVASGATDGEGGWSLDTLIAPLTTFAVGIDP
jgi:hypothetical protein